MTWQPVGVAALLFVGFLWTSLLRLPTGYSLAGLYGIALAGVGMLAPSPCCSWA
ncbi:MAG: hypothetical protein QME87_14455 [Bacillota bacterium]|nr:hypothetical protein [Bacillota bacterium]